MVRWKVPEWKGQRLVAELESQQLVVVGTLADASQ